MSFFPLLSFVRYAGSYRDLEEIMAERGVNVDHTTLNRWTVRYAPLIAEEAKKKKPSVSGSWPMDETYIKVKGRWVYLYRAVDTLSNTIDFMLSEKRDEAAETAFFKQAIDNNGMPEKESSIRVVRIMPVLKTSMLYSS